MCSRCSAERPTGCHRQTPVDAEWGALLLSVCLVVVKFWWLLFFSSTFECVNARATTSIGASQQQQQHHHHHRKAPGLNVFPVVLQKGRRGTTTANVSHQKSSSGKSRSHHLWPTNSPLQEQISKKLSPHLVYFLSLSKYEQASNKLRSTCNLSFRRPPLPRDRASLTHIPPSSLQANFYTTQHLLQACSATRLH
jgi:hypothetical protein